MSDESISPIDPSRMLCVFCGASTLLRRDKRQRPYLCCAFCGTRVFVHSDLGLIGLFSLLGVVQQISPEVWREAVSKHVESQHHRQLSAKCVDQLVKVARPSSSAEAAKAATEATA